MTKEKLLVFLIAILISFSVQPLIASDDDYDDDYSDDDYKERVYGWELMTDEEFATHREKMRSLDTREERQAYRKEHHEKMLERAKEQGIELSDCPRPGMRGKGAGRG
ncbi:MAG: hypothetical protein ACR2PU_00030 [Gammaproteobacteria bacterium]